jgi:hypothetical protein
MPASVEELYASLPEWLQPYIQKWYYVLNPRLSWTYRQKPDVVDEQFVDRHFESRAEFEGYREEFLSGPIHDICMAAAEETPEGYTVFDTHREECVKYYALLRKREPDVVVETGVYSGVSTASILLALADNGRGTLYSIDNAPALADDLGAVTADGPMTDRQIEGRSRHFRRERPSCSDPGSARLPPDREPGWILPDWLRERWDLTVGRSQRELPRLLVDLGEVDAFVHDSEHSTSGMLFEFDLAYEWLSPGGVILSSHVEWNDAFETFVEERDCEHGLTSFHYLGYEGHPVPCSTGYVCKPRR